MGKIKTRERSETRAHPKPFNVNRADSSACITQRRKNTADSTKGVGMQPLTSVSLPLSHQVLVPTAGIRGFLDASDYGTWLKYIREAKADEDIGGKSNVRHFLLAGQIYYETTRDIEAGEELLLGPKASETLFYLFEFYLPLQMCLPVLKHQEENF